MTHHSSITTVLVGAQAGPTDHGQGPATPRGSVADVVTVFGAAPILSYRVRLHRLDTGKLVAQMWSAPGTGAYHFADLELDTAYVPVALDHTGTNKSAAAGPLQPVAS